MRRQRRREKSTELAGLCGCLRGFWSLASLGCGTLNSTAAGLHQESADGDGWGGSVRAMRRRWERSVSGKGAGPLTVLQKDFDLRTGSV